MGLATSNHKAKRLDTNIIPLMHTNKHALPMTGRIERQIRAKHEFANMSTFIYGHLTQTNT